VRADGFVFSDDDGRTAWKPNRVTKDSSVTAVQPACARSDSTISATSWRTRCSKPACHCRRVAPPRSPTSVDNARPLRASRTRRRRTSQGQLCRTSSTPIDLHELELTRQIAVPGAERAPDRKHSTALTAFGGSSARRFATRSAIRLAASDVRSDSSCHRWRCEGFLPSMRTSPPG
jgi:hypothetical protein